MFLRYVNTSLFAQFIIHSQEERSSHVYICQFDLPMENYEIWGHQFGIKNEHFKIIPTYVHTQRNTYQYIKREK